MTFSFGGLDIRHRLPDRKGVGKLVRRKAHVRFEGVSTPQDGASPSRIHHRTSLPSWQFGGNQGGLAGRDATPGLSRTAPCFSLDSDPGCASPKFFLRCVCFMEGSRCWRTCGSAALQLRLTEGTSLLYRQCPACISLGLGLLEQSKRRHLGNRVIRRGPPHEPHFRGLLPLVYRYRSPRPRQMEDADPVFHPFRSGPARSAPA